MGQSKPPTTEITPQKPILVQTVVPRSVQYGLSEMYKTTAENATRSMATRNAALDSLLGRPTTPYMEDSGEVIAPNLAPTTFDSSMFFNPNKNKYLAQEMKEAENRARRQKKNRLEQEKADMEKQSYLSALRLGAGRVQNP